MEPDKQSVEQPSMQPEKDVPQVEVAPAAPSASTAEPVISKSGGVDGKKVGIILAIVLALVLVAGAVWYFVLRDRGDDTGQGQNTGQSQTEDPADQLLTEPDRVAYAHRDNADAPYKLYTRSATSEGDRTEVMTLPDGVHISQHAVRGNQVAFAVEPTANSADKASIYYSGDSGASYQQVYEAEAAGAQFTSLIFSTEGDSIVFGLLSDAGSSNRVTRLLLDEIDITTAELFTSDSSGVFLTAYSAEKNLVVYAHGCYNCDGFPTELLARDATGAEWTVYKSESNIAFHSAANQDVSKVMIVEGTAGPESEIGGPTIVSPYNLSVVDLVSRERTEAITVVEEGMVQDAGFTLTDVPYVATDKQVIKIGDNMSTLFETSRQISGSGVLFVGDDSVVTKLGTDADFTLGYFKIGNEDIINILTGDSNTVIFGVTLE